MKSKATLLQKAANGQQSGNSNVSKQDWRQAFQKRTVGVEDMTLLSNVSNEDILRNLEKRFQSGQNIYTYIGHVLISVNPYRQLPDLYCDQQLLSYRNRQQIEMPPHVYAVAENAFRRMSSYNENQCVIISGESGAGKTENAKKILHYLTFVTESQPRSSSLAKDRVLSTNPLLESFGNAKTLRNDNSSRFGKYLEVEFGASNEILGAKTSNFLLEKSRVTFQTRGERNFHILYQLTRGASETERNNFCIYGPDDYIYTNGGDCVNIPGVDDALDFSETRQAMNTIGISPEQQNFVIQALAAILWLGNINFFPDNQDNAQIESADVINMVAYLLNVQPELLNYALCNRCIETGSQRSTVYHVPLNEVQANAARNSLAQSIYARIFDWIVAKINVSLRCPAGHQKSIGILDIYGFEIFEQNNFEQLCINYVNEKLQQIFIELTLKSEQEEYVQEGIKWTPIDFFNNKIVCDLIEEKRPPGIFAILNDVVATAHADSDAADRSLVQRLANCSHNPHFQSRGQKFCVRHYAGDVIYDAKNMSEKNKDQLGQELVQLMKSSTNLFLQELFPESIDLNDRKRLPTASDRIKRSAGDLFDTLMRTEPSYIRCIKPNELRSPSEFDYKRVMHQVKYLGLLENVRIRRAGYCSREIFDKFVDRFYLLSRHTSYAGEYIWKGDAKNACMHILKDSNIHSSEWQLGRSKVFIRHPETLWALEHLRQRFWHNMAAKIQRCYRNYVRRRNEAASMIQRTWRKWKTVKQFIQLRDYGHTVYSFRKERRAFSLISCRRFMGDYLAYEPRLRDIIVDTCRVAPSSVVFIGRCEVLVHRFLRSSVLMERYLVITPNTIFLANHGKSPADLLVLDRAISMRAVMKVSTSSLSDDFLIIHIAGEQPDLVMASLLKTEILAHLQCINQGSLVVEINNELSYKKKAKSHSSLIFVKDIKVGPQWIMKRSKVIVGQGQPTSSVSNKPIPKQSVLNYHPAKTGSKPKILLYQALYSYQAQRQDELAFAVNDILELLKKDENGWFHVRVWESSSNTQAGCEGWVPANYLKEYAAANIKKAPPIPKARLPANLKKNGLSRSEPLFAAPPMYPKSSFTKEADRISYISDVSHVGEPVAPSRKAPAKMTTPLIRTCETAIKPPPQLPAVTNSTDIVRLESSPPLVGMPKQATAVSFNALSEIKLKPVPRTENSPNPRWRASSSLPPPAPPTLKPTLKPISPDPVVTLMSPVVKPAPPPLRSHAKTSPGLIQNSTAAQKRSMLSTPTVSKTDLSNLVHIVSKKAPPPPPPQKLGVKLPGAHTIPQKPISLDQARHLAPPKRLAPPPPQMR